jgi:hypothetical protein
VFAPAAFAIRMKQSSQSLYLKLERPMFDARVVKVMIASPGDVLKERDAAGEVLYECNNIHAEDRGPVLFPFGWKRMAEICQTPVPRGNAARKAQQ